MLKVNELVVGDWISSDVRPAKIAALQSKEHAIFNGDWANGEWTICIEQDGDYFIDSIDNCDFKPIPLTEEMLKVNGFYEGKVGIGLRVFFRQEDDSIAYRVSTKCNQYTPHLSTADDFDGNLYVLCNVCYVHELQHILRICGLHELADNFKIE